MPKIIKTKSVNKKIKRNPILSYVFCALKGLLLTACILFILSFLLYKGSEATSFFKIGIYISIVIGSFFSGFDSYKKIKNKGILDGAISGLFFLIMLMLVSLLLMRFNVSYQLLINAPLVMLSSVFAGVLSANKR